ncbi:hypothetical protein ACOSQ2_030547 [Xanthoceras sorbifolium]
MDLLTRTKMLDSRPCATPAAVSIKLSAHDGDAFHDPSLYRSTIGALQYLTLSRPDLAYIVNKLSQFLSAPTNIHWQACKRVLRYIRGTSDFGLIFQKSSNLSLECFVDADWASSIDDRRSTSGYCAFLGGNLVTWSSKKQHVVAWSSTEAEYRSLAHGTAEVVWLSSLLHELGFPLSKCPIL